MDNLQSNEYYYNLRAHYSFHEVLLKDYEAINTFRQVLSFNPLQIRNKILLDIGSGPGLFSLLAARAGARKVYAWEPSLQSEYSRKNIEENGFSDVIEVLNGPIEQLGIEKVDAVFSSNFGFGLYLSSLIPELKYARDHYLKEDGITLPSKCALYVSTYSPSVSFRKKSFWCDVYGFDFTPIEDDQSPLPYLASVRSSQIKTNPCLIWKGEWEDDGKVPQCEFRLDVVSDGQICGFLLWFDLIFELPNRAVELSTSPNACDTHWCQVCVPFGEPADLHVHDVISGAISISAARSMREVAYHIEYRIGDGQVQVIDTVFK